MSMVRTVGVKFAEFCTLCVFVFIGLMAASYALAYVLVKWWGL